MRMIARVFGLVLALGGCVESDVVAPGPEEGTTRVESRTIIPSIAATVANPERFLWRKDYRDGTRVLAAPLAGAITAGALRAKGFRPVSLHMRRKGPPLQEAFAPSALETSVSFSALVCTQYSQGCIGSTGQFMKPPGGRLVYATQTAVLEDPGVESMHITFDLKDADGTSLQPPKHQFVEFAGTFVTDFRLLGGCAPGVESLNGTSLHWGSGSLNSTPVVTEIDSNGDYWECDEGGSTGGSGDGNEVHVSDGPAGSWICAEYDLAAGTWAVFIDGQYAGNIVCEE